MRVHLLHEGFLYVANTNELIRFPYREGDNGHWTRNLVASADGSKIYVAVVSASNIADQGMEAESGRAAIWEFNPDGTHVRIFASGLRNTVGMSWEPTTGALWVAVNERDMLGDNLVPDYITHVEAGAFYGWPYYYWGDHRDERVDIPANVRLQSPTAPDFALGAHTASLGLMFSTSVAMPEQYRGGAFIGQHGSWNRSELVGYRVAYVPFADGRPVVKFKTF